MTGRTIIGGKVMRAPDLERLDRAEYREPIDVAPSAPVTKTNLFLDKDAPRTWARDKALLVSLGVDGDVPFFEAARNAELLTVSQTGGVLYATRDYSWFPRNANDNTKSAAIAA